MFDQVYLLWQVQIQRLYSTVQYFTELTVVLKVDSLWPIGVYR